MIKARISPNGLINIASLILPVSKCSSDLVEPQEGHGIPLIFLKRQAEASGEVHGKCPLNKSQPQPAETSISTIP
jgi:hypothetical protein